MLFPSSPARAPLISLYPAPVPSPPQISACSPQSGCVSRTPEAPGHRAGGPSAAMITDGIHASFGMCLCPVPGGGRLEGTVCSYSSVMMVMVLVIAITHTSLSQTALHHHHILLNPRENTVKNVLGCPSPLPLSTTILQMRK